MTVRAYLYSEWTEWPEEDIREWADELVAAFSLEPYQAANLLRELLFRAGQFRPPPERASYPRKMTEESEASMSAAYIEWHADRLEGKHLPNSVALEVFEENKRINRPYKSRESTPMDWKKNRVVGSGLTERVYWTVTGGGIAYEENLRALKKSRKFKAKRPLKHEEKQMLHHMREWLWWAGCIELSPDRWMVPESENVERAGMWWYFEAVMSRLTMAERQIKEGQAERAAWHSLQAGRLFTEMELKANYDDFFIKAQRTRDAQADGGRSTRKGPKEARQEAWWKYRRDGYASVMAGEMAGQELGVHEATIRRAFDGGYPGLDP